MNIEHLVLAVVGYSSDSIVSGRTLLQKTVYFLNEKLDQKISFSPHYYGPYSDAVARSTDSLVALGLLTERVEEFPPPVPSANFDARRYTYQLSKAGQDVLDKLETEDALQKLAQVKMLVEEMKELAGGDHRYLSVAAKMHHILKRRGKPVSATEISKEAQVLGWRLVRQDIEGVKGFLQKLKLARIVPKKT